MQGKTASGVGNFDFAKERWPQLWDAARRAEEYIKADPRTAAAQTRRAAELFTQHIFDVERLTRPYDANFAQLIDDHDFIEVASRAVAARLDVIRRIGNRAVHRDEDVSHATARTALESLHVVLLWLDFTYGDPALPEPPAFDWNAVPPAPAVVITRTREQLAKTQQQLEQRDAELAAARQEDAALRAELDLLRAELAANKAENTLVHTGVIDPATATEAETRTELIDLLLAEAGWPLTAARDREWPVSGIPSASGTGRVDYVLWGDDGRPLAVVEAKRTRASAKEGRAQAKLYAGALEASTGQRPIVFYTNGYEHWIWDDMRSAPRRISGFLTKDQLVLAIQRRTSTKPFSAVAINREIAARPYQLAAIRAVTDAFAAGRRRALLVMATGTGKTRTVISLVDVLQRANWVKRVLFLADRTQLVTQAVGAFKEHLPDSAPVNLVEDKTTDGRVYVSTYQTVMGVIDAGEDDLRRFGPGYFDLIVVDEAHRSIYHRYGEIFDYFDAHLVGLTATPRAEVDHNTYRLFELEDGVPTEAFELDDAIAGGYLVPPVAWPIDLGFIRRGIRYDQLSTAEQEEWDALEWEGGEIPDEVDAAAMNRWLFNADTVDKVLEVLMEHGIRVGGGDRLGKTILFAKSQAHADFIEERFDVNYPHLRGQFAQVITHRSGPYAGHLIDDFKTPGRAPHLAISVDMLDTGLDVPDLVNLVFFKPVHSQTKYWQMIGRGTRLRPDLFGPGSDKTQFIVFDVCGNIEYFNQELPEATAARPRGVGERLVTERFALLRLLGDDTEELRESLIAWLSARVAGMNRDNFLVRRHLRAVDRFADPAAWRRPHTSDDAAAIDEVASLPSAADTDTDEAAKRFDLLIIAAQQARAAGEPVPPALVSRLRQLAGLIGDQRGVPVVEAQRWLLDALADPGWWEAASLAQLEDVRVRLRGLLALIDARHQAPVYTDFEDTLGERRELEIARVSVGLDRRAFRTQLLAFLREHEQVVALHKLRTGRALTDSDLAELERILVETGGVDAAALSASAREAQGLGRFIRSIVGLERSAVEELVGDFVAAPGFTRSQQAFVDLVVNELTVEGRLDTARLYEDPFSGVAPQGPEAIFTEAQISDLISRLDVLDRSADPVSARA